MSFDDRINRINRLSSRFAQERRPTLRLMSVRSTANHQPDDIMEIWIDASCVGRFTNDEWSWALSHPSERIRGAPDPIIVPLTPKPDPTGGDAA